MSFTSYLQKKLLDHFLGITPYTAPVALYLSLHTASPTDAGSFASEISTIGTGYARQSITTKMGVTDPTTGISLNSTIITFPVITATYGATAVAFLGISDALTAGNMCVWGTITEPQNKTVGEAYQFTANQLSLALD